MPKWLALIIFVWLGASVIAMGVVLFVIGIKICKALKGKDAD